MLQARVGQLEEEVLDKILADAFYWLVSTFGDRSIELNKTPAARRNEFIRHYFSKCQLHLVWDYNPHNLPWYYEGQYGQYNVGQNQLVLHADKRETLEWVLDGLFHEYKHSQQSMYLYSYLKVGYEDHPLEIEAQEFAKEQIPIFWKYYSEKVASK